MHPSNAPVLSHFTATQTQAQALHHLEDVKGEERAQATGLLAFECPCHSAIIITAARATLIFTLPSHHKTTLQKQAKSIDAAAPRRLENISMGRGRQRARQATMPSLPSSLLPWFLLLLLLVLHAPTTRADVDDYRFLPTPKGGGQDVSYYVNAACRSGSRVYVGGGFNLVGDEVAFNFG